MSGKLAARGFCNVTIPLGSRAELVKIQQELAKSLGFEPSLPHVIDFLITKYKESRK